MVAALGWDDGWAEAAEGLGWAGVDHLLVVDVAVSVSIEWWVPRWWADAACRGMGTDLFFDPARLAEAERVCAACPVTAQCGRWAARQGVNAGVWAGQPAPGAVRCGECREDRPLVARGLCNRCYKRALRRWAKAT